MTKWLLPVLLVLCLCVPVFSQTLLDLPAGKVGVVLFWDYPLSLSIPNSVTWDNQQPAIMFRSDNNFLVFTLPTGHHTFSVFTTDPTKGISSQIYKVLTGYPYDIIPDKITLSLTAGTTIFMAYNNVMNLLRISTQKVFVGNFKNRRI